MIVAKKIAGRAAQDDGRGQWNSTADENNLFFRVGNRTLISRIIESKFPNFEAVIPKDNPHLLRVAEGGVHPGHPPGVPALRPNGPGASSSRSSKGSLKLFSSNPEIGEARDDLEVDYNGTELEVGFNSQYLLDFLMSIRSERVRLEIKDENSAAIMKPDLDEDIKYTYVLMPMKI